MADTIGEVMPCLSCGQSIDKRSVRCMHCLKEVNSSEAVTRLAGSRNKLWIIVAGITLALVGYGYFRDAHQANSVDPSAVKNQAYSLKELDSKLKADNSSEEDEESQKQQKNYNEQNMNDSVSEWTKAIEKNPKNAQAYLERGWAYNDLQQYENAIYDLSKAIALNPKNSAAYSKRAWVYDTKEEYRKAVADATIAIRLDSKNSEAYEARACAYASLGDSVKAASDSSKSENISLEINR